jgi:predicted dehydrogenase
MSKRIAIVAVAEPDVLLREYASELLPRARVYESHLDMLVKERLDMVSICSPDALHACHLIDVIEAGVPGVWCEKPLATMAAELDRIECMAKTSPIPKIQLNYWRRFVPEVAGLRGSIADRAFGSINCISGYYPDGWFRNGSHLVDLMVFLAGELEVVSAMPTGFGEDPGLAVLGMGKTGFAWSAMAVPRNRYNIFELDIHCQHARLRVIRNGRAIEIVLDEGDPDFPNLRILNSSGERLVYSWRRSFSWALENLLDCMDGRVADTASPLGDALRVAKLVIYAREKAVSGTNSLAGG